ncbi:NACalpha-BTF3-like transcription factor [Microbacterium trichothecenolyticum]|uniref:DUF2510 domain-containing protein n=1 Tax=Microbacterium trichothecenolyticum TaxID=69370 RepID=UPI0028557390|nr:DUF2510 domain-containing protein [Microbacterium trichothecenolyticum]MDR7183224.1 NACalpha-BTF3-like transcription factor [Microbacterium trichothecenolyticum]
MTTTPPGWYDDGHGAMRWWDGTQWTEHVAQPDPEASPAPTEAEIVAGAGAVEPGEPELFATEPASPAAPPYPVQEGYAPVEGYPQGVYPGTPEGIVPAGGGFAAATEPRSTSKLWIVWVVLGVVLLGIVIAAAVVIPLLLLSASTANSAGQSDDERAAVATVGLYDDAWQEGDCDSFAAATSENFRDTVGLLDCATFESQASAFDENFDDYEIKVTDVETVGDQVAVTTNETYTALIDEDGQPTDPAPGATVYHYTLVQADGEWVIDDLSYE